jgi:hypothetical protein
MPAKTTQPSKDVTNPYGYTEMDWAAQLDPAYAAARAEVRRLSVGEEGTLSVKVKEFVVMGVLASRGLQCGSPGAPGTRTGGGLPAAQPVFPLAEPAEQSQPTPISAPQAGQSGHTMSGGLPTAARSDG